MSRLGPIAVVAALGATCAGSPERPPPVAPPRPGSARPLPVAGSTRPAVAPARAPTDAGDPPPRAGEAGDAAQDAPPRRFREPVVAPERTRVVVLLYHAFDVGSELLSVDSRDFSAQLDWLSRKGIDTVFASEAAAFVRGELSLPERAVALTIDDGMASVHSRAWPILKAHGARFTLGIPTSILDEPRPPRTLSREQIAEMVASGLCEIASHGHRHRSLVGATEEVARKELVGSRETLEGLLGAPPQTYFYPLGAHDPVAERRVLAAGYRGAFAAAGGIVRLGAVRVGAIPRVSIRHGDSTYRLAGYFSRARLRR